MYNQETIAHQRDHWRVSARRATPFIEDALGVFLEPELADHPDFHDGWAGVRPRQVCLDQDQARPSKRIVTRPDSVRLREALTLPVVDAQRAGSLSRALAEAQVVCPTDVSPRVITMNSLVVCEDVKRGKVSTFRLVYPHEQRSDEDISVLHPLGSALLGRRVGEHAHSSEQGHYAVRDVPYQPEAAGHLHL